jgi:DNA polymerase-3 subunit delta'
MSSNIPAYLFIGSPQEIYKRACTFIAERLCSAKNCAECVTCKAISEKRHHNLLWITPDRSYTKELLAPLFHRLTFAQDTDELFFFVLQDADLLTLACANSLLKSLEEPPPGYFFLLLSTTHDILPTIRSRCIIIVDNSSLKVEENSLLRLLQSPDEAATAHFLKLFPSLNLTEHAVTDCFDAALLYWRTQYISALESNNNSALKRAQAVTAILERALQYPPMPGSGKLAFKNVFMQLITLFT